MAIKWTSLLLIALGGGLGSVLRALLSFWLRASMPWGTFAVNVSGCLLIGLIAGFGGGVSSLSDSARSFWVIGFCGGFTTFSTFSYENIALLEQGRTALAFAYMALSLLVCLAAVYLGLRLARPA